MAVALKELPEGTVLNTANHGKVTLLSSIARGHKIALEDIGQGTNIIKYGYPIGHATQDIKRGEHVHIHNIATNLSGELKYRYTPIKINVESKKDNRMFMGYKRLNGKVGIRNDLYILPVVGSVSELIDPLIAQFKALHPDNGNFDNVEALKHTYGIDDQQDNYIQTRKILVDAVLQPNAGAVLICGLGSEDNSELLKIKEDIKLANGYVDTNRIKFLSSYDSDDEITDGLSLLEELNTAIRNDVRTPQPLSELKIGLKCGGSDGLSGVTANPLLGRLSDFIVAQGGTTVLSEVPEMFGAEKILMSRAKNIKTFNKIVDLINDFKTYFERFHQPIYENPSPGNKEGGISTLEDKSLGCTQKSGTSAVNDVLKYGDKLKARGLNLLQAPGNDLVSSSAEASADCQMVLFTTGRGTPFATYVPTIKVSSNSYIANLKPRWIDFDAGELMNESIDEVTAKFIQYVIDVASGEKTNNEKYDVHGIAIFKTGVTK